MVCISCDGLHVRYAVLIASGKLLFNFTSCLWQNI